MRDVFGKYSLDHRCEIIKDSKVVGHIILLSCIHLTLKESKYFFLWVLGLHGFLIIVLME